MTVREPGGYRHLDGGRIRSLARTLVAAQGRLPASAAGQACSTAAQARWTQVGSPVCPR